MTNDYGKDYTSPLDVAFNNAVGENLAVTTYKHMPSMVPHFINLTYRTLAGRSHGSPLDLLSIPEYDIDYLDFEVAVPVATANQALQQLRQMVLEWQQMRGYYLWFGVFVRYIKADNYPLSMAYQTDVVSFSFPLYDSTESQAFISAVTVLLGTRWHTGKYQPLPIEQHNGWDAMEPYLNKYDPSGRFLPTTTSDDYDGYANYNDDDVRLVVVNFT